MSDLLPTRIAQSPLLILAAAISTGILLGSCIASHPRSVLVLGACVVAGFAILSIWLIRKRRVSAAPVLMVVAFIVTGFALSLIEARDVSPNRILRGYEQ